MSTTSSYCEAETVTIPVTWYLDVSFSGTSGVQVWGPFCSRQSAEQTVTALATRAGVDRVEIRKEPA